MNYKYFVVFFVFFQIGLLARAQYPDTETFIRRTINRDLNSSSPLFKYDTCSLQQVLIKIEFDSLSQYVSLSVSDNAQSWLSEEINRLKRRIDLNTLNSLAGKENIAGKCMIFPLELKADLFSKICSCKYDDIKIPEKYFYFNGQLLNQNIIFCKPIFLFIGKLQH